MKTFIRPAIFALLAISLMLGCSRTVTRMDAGESIDLSGRWNDTDSRLVAEEMIGDLIGRSWITDHIEETGRKPVVIVGLVKNSTHELISTESFIKEIERALINSGQVRVVSAANERAALRDERLDQQDNASPETVNRWGMELGADYMLQGVISSIVDSYKKDRVVFYQTDLDLTHLESNEKVWLNTKKIKKLVEN
jgi:uncharacterized protein (TIGR02722 family)